MSDIYDQHKAAFSGVSAYVILKDGERVATVAFKYPRNGASRLYAYVHWLGLPMVRGYAGGGGYDKHSAACASAVNAKTFVSSFNAAISYGSDRSKGAGFHDCYHAFRAAMAKDGGPHWHQELERAGFKVLQAV